MKVKEYKSIFKIKEQNEKEKAINAIKEIIETSWSGSNEDQGKMVQTMKGLAFNDSKIANDFMNDLDKFTDTLGEKYLSQEDK